jgi:hypothetical protein
MNQITQILLGELSSSLQDSEYSFFYTSFLQLASNVANCIQIPRIRDNPDVITTTPQFVAELMRGNEVLLFQQTEHPPSNTFRSSNLSKYEQ